MSFFVEGLYQLLCIHVVVNLELLDLVFQFLQSCYLRVLELVQPGLVLLHLFHLLLQLVDDPLCSRELALGRYQLLLQNLLAFLALCHLVPQVRVVLELLCLQIDLIRRFLLPQHFFHPPEQSLLAHQVHTLRKL